jgi:hypothetical protein
MFWVFSHDRDEIRLETSSDVSSADFVVDIVHADGRRGTERFADQRQFWTWLLAMRRALTAQDWTLSGPFRSADAALRSPAGQVPGTARANSLTQLCRRGDRIFHVVMSTRQLHGISRWVIDDVVDMPRVERVFVPGLSIIASASPETALVEACAHIDAWLCQQPGESDSSCVPHLGGLPPERPVPVCARCHSVHSRVVGHNEQPSIVRRECLGCGYVWSNPPKDWSD